MVKHYNTIAIFVITVVLAVQGLGQLPGLDIQHSTGAFQNMFKQHLSGLRQGPITNMQGSLLQQYVGIPAGLDAFLKMQRVGSDSFFEPYWDKGEWVFVRDTFVPRLPRYLASYSDLEPDLVKECIEFCPRIYEGYGPVCGHFVSMSNGMTKMKQFMNLCHMYFDNCIKSKTNRYNIDDPWKPLFQGNCIIRWKGMENSGKAIASNADNYLAKLVTSESPAIKTY